MPQILSANVAQNIVDILSARSIPLLQGQMVMPNLVDRDYSSAMAAAGYGDTVTVNLPPTLSAGDLAEGGEVQTQNATSGKVNVTLNRHKYVSFSIPEVTKLIVGKSWDVIDAHLGAAMLALAESVEIDLTSLYVGLTQNAALGAGSTPLTEGLIDQAETSLFDARIPEAYPRILLVTSGDYSVIRQIPRFSEANAIDSGLAITTGKVGQIKGFNVIRSQFVQASGGANKNLAFTRPAFAFVTRDFEQVMPGTGAVSGTASFNGLTIRIVMSYNSKTLSYEYTAHILYGCAVPRPGFGLVLNS